MHTHLLLGRYERRYGQLHWEEPCPGVGCALSVGADPKSPALQFKGHPDLPNEDGLLVAWEGTRLLLAVADGHLGVEGSEGVLKALAGLRAMPRDAEELAAALKALPVAPWLEPCGTTLLVARLDRSSGQAFGFSWGDSRAVAVGDTVRVLTEGNVEFLKGEGAPDLAAAQAFALTLAPGELLFLCTDGVHECHYRSPATSVGEAELRCLAGMRPGPAVRDLAQLALDGARGNPGGQDNLAVVGAGR